MLKTVVLTVDCFRSSSFPLPALSNAISTIWEEFGREFKERVKSGGKIPIRDPLFQNLIFAFKNINLSVEPVTNLNRVRILDEDSKVAAICDIRDGSVRQP